jgi:hypothetical protein
MLSEHFPGIDFLPSIMYLTISLAEQSRPPCSLFVLAVINACYMYKEMKINNVWESPWI